MNNRFHVLAPLALAISAASAADRAPTEIIITASRSLAPLTERLDAATVITRDDIARQQAASVADLLSQVPGISLPASGGPISTTGVFLRGFKSNQVLVLIDGVRANDSNSGQFDFGSLRPDDIERIEVVRGGYSSQYGSDAMGGVIHVFTRRQSGNSLSVRAGSFGTWESGVTVSQALGQGQWGAALSELRTRGFDAGNENFPAANFVQNQPDRDGGRQRTLRLHADQHLGEAHRVSASALFKELDTQFDNGLSNGTNALLNAAYRGVVSQKYQHRVELGHNRTRSTTDDVDNGPGKFDTLRNTVNWIHTVDAGTVGTGTVGLVLSEESTKAPGLVRDLQNQAIFAINENVSGPWSYRLSGRHERHEQWGTQTTGSFRGGLAASATVHFYGGFGTNFRAPTANELFNDQFGTNNPALRPERSRQYDLGGQWRFRPGHSAGLSLFRNEVSNLIGFGPGFVLANTQSATLEGVELELKGQHGKLGYQLGLLRARSIDDATGNDLLRRPRLQLNGDVYYRLHGHVTVGLQNLSRNPVNDFSGRNDGFAVFNAYVTWRALHALDLGLRLDNLTDRDYELARGFRTPGRSGYITATYRF